LIFLEESWWNTSVRASSQSFSGARILVDLLFRRLNRENTPSATMQAELIVHGVLVDDRGQ
jgi:hypothetical protein